MALPVLHQIRNGLEFRRAYAENRGQSVSFLIMQVTKACNCRCEMCSIWAMDHSNELTTDEFEKVFKDPLFRDLEVLSLTGGEPFIRKDFADICRLAQENLPKLKVISCPSNGVLGNLIMPAMHKILESIRPDVFFKLGISIDGFEEAHNKVRGIPTAYKRALDTFEKLSQIKHPNFDCGILSLIVKETIPHLDQVHEHFSKYTEHQTYTLLMIADFFGNNGDIQDYTAEEKEQIRRFFLKLMELQPQKSYLYHNSMKQMENGKRNYPCVAGYRTAYIDSFGALFPCHYLPEGDYRIGSIRDAATLESAWFSDHANKLREKMKTSPVCATCSNNCDMINTVREEFFDFAKYSFVHPLQTLKGIATTVGNPKLAKRYTLTG
ncbi:MAG: radical SAM protein [Candidatus Sumerlaeia bacterium]|nr:radical SAM protein [Candidatus Sumerlaeia bacterium]